MTRPSKLSRAWREDVPRVTGAQPKPGCVGCGEIDPLCTAEECATCCFCNRSLDQPPPDSDDDVMAPLRRVTSGGGGT